MLVTPCRAPCIRAGGAGRWGVRRAMTEEQPPTESGEAHPKGTVAVLVVFLLMIIALWASVYVILLARGVTA